MYCGQAAQKQELLNMELFIADSDVATDVATDVAKDVATDVASSAVTVYRLSYMHQLRITRIN